MKWIKVEDRLPEVDVNVIALTSKGKVMVTSMYIPKDCRGKILGKAEWHGKAPKAEEYEKAIEELKGRE